MEKNKPFPRTCLYRKDFPKGKIFDDEAEYNQAVKDGWLEAPQEIGLTPDELKKLRVKNITQTDAQKLVSENEQLRKANLELYTRNVELEEEIEKLKAQSSKLKGDGSKPETDNKKGEK
jgi:hypothetical protein